MASSTYSYYSYLFYSDLPRKITHNDTEKHRVFSGGHGFALSGVLLAGLVHHEPFGHLPSGDPRRGEPGDIGWKQREQPA